MTTLTPLKLRPTHAVRRRGQLIVPKWGRLLLGPELILNGENLTDTSNWTARTAILSVVNGSLNIADNGQFSVAHQQITTIISEHYQHRIKVVQPTSATQIGFGWGNGPPAALEYAENEIRDTSPAYPAEYKYVFQAETAATWFSVGPNTPENCLIELHSVRQVLGGTIPELPNFTGATGVPLP